MDDELEPTTDPVDEPDDESAEDAPTILNEIKQMLGIVPETTEFDIDILSSINSAFFTLHQLGIGGSTAFYIEPNSVWADLQTTINYTIIRDYLYLKTKVVFDPPSSSSVAEAYKNRISELEFRMNIEVDNGGGVVNDG